MKNSESETFVHESSGVIATMKRKASGCYVLDASNSPCRSRYGTLAEIRADLAHFMVCGRLPQPDGPRW